MGVRRADCTGLVGCMEGMLGCPLLPVARKSQLRPFLGTVVSSRELPGPWKGDGGREPTAAVTG